MAETSAERVQRPSAIEGVAGSRTEFEEARPRRKPTIERLGAFSDGVFAVLITIMVLELKPPEHPTFAALLPLWSTGLSYAVSYQFIAIVWTNHHHLLRFAEEPTPRLIWINFAHLFMVSLVPFATAWVARTDLAPVPVFLYAAVFVMVEVVYLQFERHALALAIVEDLPHRARRFAKARSLVALSLFIGAMAMSLQWPRWAFGAVCCAVLLYLRPDLTGIGTLSLRAEGQVNSKGAPHRRDRCER